MPFFNYRFAWAPKPTGDQSFLYSAECSERSPIQNSRIGALERTRRAVAPGYGVCLLKMHISIVQLCHFELQAQAAWHNDPRVSERCRAVLLQQSQSPTTSAAACHSIPARLASHPEPWDGADTSLRSCSSSSARPRRRLTGHQSLAARCGNCCCSAVPALFGTFEGALERQEKDPEAWPGQTEQEHNQCWRKIAFQSSD